MLEELAAHLEDDHLHIIAPPGSGKTVLGLEVALQLNKPTLVFAPSIAIRNQWIQRFCELFLQVTETPDWISRDIKNPKFLTVSTYQALHAVCSGDVEEEDGEWEEELENDPVEKSVSNTRTEVLIAQLQAINIGTIVVDEAHHLKNAWWQSLTTIKKALNPTVVGLTATPPYDVSALEWQRYTQLNGPVDTEISIPELVVEGDLCPHQDYVFFSHPTAKEKKTIGHHRQRIDRLFEEIKTDDMLIKGFLQHPTFTTPLENIEWIYSNLEYYSAMLIFLHAIGEEITATHLEVIGDAHFKIPKLNYDWIETLLTFYLYKDPDNFKGFEAHQEKLSHQLKRNGAIERRAINFKHHRKINRSLSSSISKLKSIERIVSFEHGQLNEALRMVILTDYIRKEFLIHETSNTLELDKIGVLPIFEQLRRNNTQNLRMGVLTGSLIIIPVMALSAFNAIAATYGLHEVSNTRLPFDQSYVIIHPNEQIKHDIVHIITQIFQTGHIQVLIGTKSLLGEGWDAPSINALILASFVGSYVLSNQMRGRAIRTARQNKEKTGNIWHLVCVDPSAADGGDDIRLLKRRFKAFVGVSLKKEARIENGVDRLGIPEQLHTREHIQEINTKMFLKAGQREHLKARWQDALTHGVSLVEEIKIATPKEINYTQNKSLYYKKTIGYLVGTLTSLLFSLFIFLYGGLLLSADLVSNGEALSSWMIGIGMVAFLLFGRTLYKVANIYIKYRDIAADIENIGKALLATLLKIGVIHTEHQQLKVIAHLDESGAIYCHLKGGTTYEKSVFIGALQETIGAVDNPRYIIIRKSFYLKMFSQKDYHSVPDTIGKKKAYALYFDKQWRRTVGACELVYTRTLEGRKLLLKSRIQSLAATLGEENAERINRWR